jgi:hypothetical protein
MARTYLGYTQVAANADLDDLAAGTASAAWIQSGTGTVARTISAKLRDTQHVADFGVLPSGSDMRALMQGALDSATAGVLVMGPGTYVFSGPLTITRPILLVGAGRGATVCTFSALGSATAGFKGTVDNIAIADLSIVGPSSAAYVLDECGVWFLGTSVTPLTGCAVRNVEVSNVGSYGVLFEYADQGIVEGCYSHDNGYMGITNLSSSDWIAVSNWTDTQTPGTVGNAFGIYVGKRQSGDTTPTRWIISGNLVSNIALWEGIDTHGGTYGIVEGNVVSGCKIGIQCGADSFGNVPHFTVVRGNTVSRGALTTTQLRGISVGGDSSTNAKGMIVSDNTVEGMGGADGSSQLLAALLVQYTDGAKIDNNSLFDCEQNGIMVDVGAVAISVTNNTVRGVTNRTGNSAALRFNVASTGVCTGNYLDSGTTYALYMNAACPSLRMDDTNVFVSSASPPVVNPANCGSGYTMSGTAVVDPGNLVDGDGTTANVTVTGAALGDIATASFSLDLQGITATAYIASANAARVRLQNETGGAIDLAQGTVTVKVVRP